MNIMPQLVPWAIYQVEVKQVVIGSSKSLKTLEHQIIQSLPNKVDLLVGVVTKNIPRTCIFFIIANPSPIGLFKPISQDPLLILNWSELRLMGSRNLKMCLIGKV